LYARWDIITQYYGQRSVAPSSSTHERSPLKDSTSTGTSYIAWKPAAGNQDTLQGVQPTEVVNRDLFAGLVGEWRLVSFDCGVANSQGAPTTGGKQRTCAFHPTSLPPCSALLPLPVLVVVHHHHQPRPVAHSYITLSTLLATVPHRQTLSAGRLRSFPPASPSLSLLPRQP
jgi:hypothetical protein